MSKWPMTTEQMAARIHELEAALVAAEKDISTVQREIRGVAPEAWAPSLPLIRAALASTAETEP